MTNLKSCLKLHLGYGLILYCTTFETFNQKSGQQSDLTHVSTENRKTRLKSALWTAPHWRKKFYAFDEICKVQPCIVQSAIKKFTKQFCLLLYTSSQIDITITIREAPAQILWQILVKYDETRCLSNGLYSLKKCPISFQQRICKVQNMQVAKYAKCKIMQNALKKCPISFQQRICRVQKYAERKICSAILNDFALRVLHFA